MAVAETPAPTWRIERPWLADAVVCDGLMPWTAEFLPSEADLAAQLRRFRRQGFDHISLTVAAGQDGPTEALARLGFLLEEISAMPSEATVAHTRAEIERAKAAGLLSVSFHFQSGTPFAPDLDLVRGFKAAGVQRAILAYNTANIFADGCHEIRDSGLTAAGRALVARMDEVGMRIDLSHCGIRTSLETMDLPLGRPQIFSHSNARALLDHARNITDEQIRACARRGGYIGINGVGMFLGAAASDIPAAMARQVAHVASIAGTDRIGLGLDFMFLEGSDYGFFRAAEHRWPHGYPPPPWDFIQPEQLGDLVAELESVGFGRQEIIGILGANYLRLAVE